MTFISAAHGTPPRFQGCLVPGIWLGAFFTYAESPGPGFLSIVLSVGAEGK